jgi:hypothetical protein
VSFFRSRQSLSYSTISEHFTEPEGLLRCSQEPSTGPYPEPYQSSPYHPIHMQMMADKGRLAVQQRSQPVFVFLWKQKCCGNAGTVTCPVCYTFRELFTDFISSSNRMVQCWEQAADDPQVCVAHRTLKLSEYPCKGARENQPGRLQTN